MLLLEIALLALWAVLTVKLVHDAPNGHAPVGRNGRMVG